MSRFDRLANRAVNATSNLYGDMCTWVTDTQTYRALVKYKDNNGDAKLGDVTYQKDEVSIEIKNSDFPGLADMLMQLKKPVVTVNVRGVDTDFTCLEAWSLTDGMCSKIKLEPVPAE